MASKYWLVVVRKENWAVDQRLNFSVRGFSRKKSAAVETMRPGDQMAIYVASGCSVVGAILEVTSRPFVVEDDYTWDDFYPCRVKTKPVMALDDAARVPFAPLVRQLAFVTDKGYWRNFVLDSLRSISTKDFNVLKKAVKAAAGKR